jgi:hypothetical protein
MPNLVKKLGRTWEPTAKDRNLVSAIQRNPEPHWINVVTGDVIVEHEGRDWVVGNLPRRLIPFKNQLLNPISRIETAYGGIETCRDNGVPGNRPDYVVNVGGCSMRAKGPKAYIDDWPID